jgi:hypothetical protein
MIYRNLSYNDFDNEDEALEADKDLEEVGRCMELDHLKEKIKAMEELEPSDNPEDNDNRRITINILKDKYRELKKQTGEEK